MAAIVRGESGARPAASVQEITTGEAGEAYAILCGEPLAPGPGFGGIRAVSEGIQEVAFPAAARTPVRSMTVAPAACAACQFRSMSRVLPAKNAKRTLSKLSASSSRMKEGSPPASVRVPAITLK